MNRSALSLLVLSAAIASAAIAQSPNDGNEATPDVDPDEVAPEELVQEIRESRSHANQSVRPCDLTEPADATSAAQAIQEKVVELRARLEVLCQRYYPNHPDLIND